MGVSTNGQICFGIMFEEDFEFPWTNYEDGEGDIESWWIYQVHGFKHDIELYDERGEYLNGHKPSDEELERYYGPKREFEKTHPLPVELVNYCSGDCAMYILAVPSSCLSARRGYPEEFNPTDLMVSAADKEVLIHFCDQHGIEAPSEPKWYLSSLWI